MPLELYPNQPGEFDARTYVDGMLMSAGLTESDFTLLNEVEWQGTALDYFNAHVRLSADEYIQLLNDEVLLSFPAAELMTHPADVFNKYQLAAINKIIDLVILNDGPMIPADLIPVEVWNQLLSQQDITQEMIAFNERIAALAGYTNLGDYADEELIHLPEIYLIDGDLVYGHNYPESDIRYTQAALTTNPESSRILGEELVKDFPNLVALLYIKSLTLVIAQRSIDFKTAINTAAYNKKNRRETAYLKDNQALRRHLYEMLLQEVQQNGEVTLVHMHLCMRDVHRRMNVTEDLMPHYVTSEMPSSETKIRFKLQDGYLVGSIEEASHKVFEPSHIRPVYIQVGVKNGKMQLLCSQDVNDPDCWRISGNPYMVAVAMPFKNLTAFDLSTMWFENKSLTAQIAEMDQAVTEILSTGNLSDLVEVINRFHENYGEHFYFIEKPEGYIKYSLKHRRDLVPPQDDSNFGQN